MRCYRLNPLPIFIASIMILSGCQGDKEVVDPDPVVRGLKTIEIRAHEERFTRSYPSVLQPASVTALSFEVGGKLQDINLDVGQSVKVGDVLATLDPTSLDLQVGNAEAALRQAESQLKIAASDFKRRESLVSDGIISKAEFDQSRGNYESALSQRDQAQKQLQSAQENLSKSQLIAPFDGIVNTVEVDPFATVSSGKPIASLYSNSAYEVSFSVSFNVAELIKVGKSVTVVAADIPALSLKGVVSELGTRANTVSSFPVVVKLTENDPRLKAGMAVAIEVDFFVPGGGGYTVPLSVIDLSSLPQENSRKRGETLPAFVFVYDASTSTVKHREVMLGGVRENDLIIIAGLDEGERVASAGVSFLSDGQKVKLLPDANSNGDK